MTGEERRAQAEALGFTREDVEALRDFDFAFHGMGSMSVEVRRDYCERLQTLAARIEAILSDREAR